MSGGEPVQATGSIRDHRGDRLIDLMGDRRRHLADQHHTIEAARSA
jgi:hypothetical protein